MGGGGEGLGEGARVSEFFLTENQNLKTKKNIFLGWGEGRGEGVDSQTDNQDQTKLPLQFLRSWGHNNE